jgi:hypothetical protein
MNLDLIINNEKWIVIYEKKEDNKKYWQVNTLHKTLIVHNVDLEKAKYSCWIQYTKK